MMRQLGILASLLVLCATTMLSAGCNNNRCSDTPSVRSICRPSSAPKRVCRPVCKPACAISVSESACEPSCPAPEPVSCEPACEPSCAPACPAPEPVRCFPRCEVRSQRCPPPCEPVCQEACKPPVHCRYPNHNELKCIDGIIVSARNPSLCMLGDQYPLEFEIKACEDVCDVVVTTHLPEGVSFIRSQPEAQVDGRTVIWDIGAMRRGQAICAKVWLRCDCEGELCACFCATATPVRFCSLLCAKPVLTCSKVGPDEVCPGDPVNYVITVTNRGTCTAEDVVVTDNVPDGVEHASCLRTLTFRLGSLEPCQSKKVNVCFTAVKRGRVCNTALVSACNAEATSCQWCTNICKECIELYKVGPKEVQIGQNADYELTVFNPGDKPLTEVVITDVAPAATSIVAAPGACINGNQAVWKLRELQPNEKVSFNLTLTTCTPGSFTNRAGVTSCQGCSDCAEFTTHWKGRPALHVQICDSKDPICKGDMTSYSITVINQGSEQDENVRVVVHFPPEIEPVNVAGDTQGQISGPTVTFAPYNRFRPKQALNFRIDGRGRQSGDARVVVEVTSASIPVPITQQESTIVN